MLTLRLSLYRDGTFQQSRLPGDVQNGVSDVSPLWTVAWSGIALALRPRFHRSLDIPYVNTHVPHIVGLQVHAKRANLKEAVAAGGGGGSRPLLGPLADNLYCVTLFLSTTIKHRVRALVSQGVEHTCTSASFFNDWFGVAARNIAVDSG